MKVLLQRGQPPRQTLNLGERQDADLGILECDRRGLVAVGPDAVEPQDFTRQVEAGDLLATILGKQRGLERSDSDRV